MLQTLSRGRSALQQVPSAGVCVCVRTGSACAGVIERETIQCLSHNSYIHTGELGG